MHIKRQNQTGLIGVLPNSQVDLAIIPDHPPAHHADLLVRCLPVFLLPEDPAPYVCVGQSFQAVAFSIYVTQVVADLCKLTPLYRPMQADIIIPVLSVHHIIIRPPAHLLEHPVAVPDDHRAPAPCQMRGKQTRNLYIGKNGLARLILAGKLRREDYRIFLEVFRVIILFRPPDQRLLDFCIHNNLQI